MLSGTKETKCTFDPIIVANVSIVHPFSHSNSDRASQEHVVFPVVEIADAFD
jgi:hypothetical protein